MGAFDRLGEYGWDVARVNYAVTDALFENYGDEVRELLESIIDDLVEEAREEWEQKQADKSDHAGDGRKPADLGGSSV
jgi:hypothetical protein